MKLSTALRKAAIDSGLSILKISEKAKLRYQSVHGFVRGKGGRDIRLSSVQKIAEAIGVTIEVKRKAK